MCVHIMLLTIVVVILYIVLSMVFYYSNQAGTDIDHGNSQHIRKLKDVDKIDEAHNVIL